VPAAGSGNSPRANDAYDVVVIDQAKLTGVEAGGRVTADEQASGGYCPAPGALGQIGGHRVARDGRDPLHQPVHVMRRYGEHRWRPEHDDVPGAIAATTQQDAFPVVIGRCHAVALNRDDDEIPPWLNGPIASPAAARPARSE